MVDLYFAAVQYIDKVKGQAFNIGGGIDYSLSLLELFTLLEEILGIKMNHKQLPPRESDQLVFVADNTKITRLTGWKPQVQAREGLIRMMEWLNI